LIQEFYLDQFEELAIELVWLEILFFHSPSANDVLFVCENFKTFETCFLKDIERVFDSELFHSAESIFLTSLRIVPGAFQSS